MIKKKYIDGSQDPKPGKAMSEFHCSRPWFPEEKPTKFKKVEKGSDHGWDGISVPALLPVPRVNR